MDALGQRIDVPNDLRAGGGIVRPLVGHLPEANDRGYECLLLADCCGATVKENHEAALRTIRFHVGKEILGHRPQALQRGDEATCLFRDADVIITGWSDARIPWPRCRSLGCRGGSGLLVDEELARAVRTESKLAIRYWWGASPTAVFNWRRALGVETMNEGSRRLRTELNQEFGGRQRGKKLPLDQVERRRRTAQELGLRPPQRPNGRLWTDEERALLGTIAEVDLAVQLHRTVNAVRVKRLRRGIATAVDRRRREGKQ